MKSYKIPLVPGPVLVPETLRAPYQIDYGSADLEEELFDLYVRCERGLQAMLGIRSTEGWTWQRLDLALRSHGMVVGGNYGPLAGKVFRIGHMGSQANRALVEQGMDVLGHVLGL